MSRRTPAESTETAERGRTAEAQVMVGRRVSLDVGCLCAALLAFAVFKLYSLNFVMGDEHMYFYMSLLVAKGKWPYRDFFFSHPPLQLYLVGALYKLFGYSLALSKAVPSLAALVSGVHVYAIGRRLVGRWEGLLASVLFLFTFDVLRGSSHFTGANCALALGLAAAYQAIAGRAVLAGVLFALGTFTGVYIAPLALMLGVLLVFRDWRAGARLLGSFAAACGLLCIVFAAVGGHAFWYQVFTYNLNKVAFRYSWYAKFRNVAYLNTLVMIGFVPGVVWAVANWVQRGRQAGPHVLPGAAGRLGAWLNLWGGDRVAGQILFVTFVCGYFYFYSTRVDYYSYYFMLIMPWMALATATFALDVARTLRTRRPRQRTDVPLSRAERRRIQRAEKRPGQVAPSPLAPLVLAAVALVAVLAYRQGIGSDRHDEMGEEASGYVWHDSPYLPAFVNRLVHGLLWQSTSNPVHPPNPLTYYLQHESLHASTVANFVAAIKRQCHPGERIFGEYSLGPFAAALGPCVLGADLADTNPHRLRVHESTAEGWVRALEADHLAIAIVAPASVMMRERELRDYFATTFPRVVESWDDPYMGHVELHRRAE